MHILLCPGIHPPELTQSFLNAFDATWQGLPIHWHVLPTNRYWPWSSTHVVQFLRTQLCQGMADRSVGRAVPIAIIGFSAGAVGAVGAAQSWRQQGGCVTCVIAIDGWGVPFWPCMPAQRYFRLSHDLFTHVTSAWLGTGATNFYADPPVPHWSLWQSPEAVQGWAVTGADLRSQSDDQTTALAFIQAVLEEA